MSPRAAWRLESMGFADVYDYVGGKIDWFGAGWPREGRPPGITRLVDVADRAVPTCRLEDRVGEVRRRLGERDVCIVTNEERVVLGLVGREELSAGADDDAVAEVMRSAPSTSRPHLSVAQAAGSLESHARSLFVLTEPDGRLVGVVDPEDVAATARREGGPG